MSNTCAADLGTEMMRKIAERLDALFWDVDDGLNAMRAILDDYADMIQATEPEAWRSIEEARSASHVLAELLWAVEEARSPSRDPGEGRAADCRPALPEVAGDPTYGDWDQQED